MTVATCIPLVDLQAQYDTMAEELDGAWIRVLRSGAFILGKEVEAFEAAFAAFCGAPHCIGVSSGTDALEQALQALGVGPGDEVITVPHTFIATVEAICAVGAKPVFVDVCPDTLLMDAAAIEAALTPRTRALLPVHLYGQMVDMDAIMTLARAKGLVVVEDAAQAHGAQWRGRRAGTWGDAAAFSFYPGKNLGAYGDAGAVVCQRADIAQAIRMGRNHGRQGKYTHEQVGRNARMDGLQGAILNAKLPKLDTWNQARRRLAQAYTQALAPFPEVRPVTLRPEATSVWHLYVVRVPRRDHILRRLVEEGIEAGIHYPLPLHLQPALADLGYGPGDFPVTEAAAAEILSLPIYPELQDAHLAFIIHTLKKALDD